MNIPYGKLTSTLGTSLKYLQPVAAKAAIGAGLGAGYSAIANDGNMGRDALVGGALGFGYGHGYHNIFNNAATATKGTYGVSAGIDAVKDWAQSGWKNSSNMSKASWGWG